jgi:hypothetical protein
MVDVWAQDASSGAPSYSGQELRLTTVLPFMAGAGASLGARSGVRPSGSGTDLLVQAQSSPNMTVKVNPGAAVMQGATSATQGPYTWALDTATNLTIASAHASLTRTDLVVVRIRDANVDTSGGRDGQPIVITGTAGGGVPSLPTDATYLTLAQVTVRPTGSGGGTIVAGDIADKRIFTAALGGVLLWLSTVTKPTNCPPGQLLFESDRGWWWFWTGLVWDFLPGTLIAWADRQTDSSSTTGETEVLRLPVGAIPAGQALHILTSSLRVFSDANDVAICAIRYTADGTTPSTTSAILGTAITRPANVLYPESKAINAVHAPGTAQTLTLLLTVSRYVGSGNVKLHGGAAYPICIWVFAAGTSVSDTGVDR